MPQGLSAGPQRPTGPARREAGQSQDRAERAEGDPGPPAGGPVRCGQRRTPTRGGGGRFPGWFHGWFGCNRCTPWLRRLHPVGALVAPHSRLGVNMLHPDGAVIHSLAAGGSGTGARFSARRLPRRSRGVAPQPCCSVEGRLTFCLSFCLIRSGTRGVRIYQPFTSICSSVVRRVPSCHLS